MDLAFFFPRHGKPSKMVFLLIYISFSLNRAAKVMHFFDICKLFLHIARNMHKIAEKEYKEDRKNCYAGSSFQFVRRVTHFQFSRRVWNIISVLASSLPYGHLHGG